MDKLITLCWQCQELFKQAYRVTIVKNAKPDAKCANCGKPHTLDLCRVQTKGE